jgi:hypothetical protein
MINVRDLMVGNIIHTRDGVIEIGKIHRESVGDKWGAIYFDDEIEGIAVTEEMLEKIGFKKNSCGDFYTFWTYWGEDYKYKLEISEGCNSNRKLSLHIDNSDCNTIGHGEFTYLHELMNLTRVVTGFDLRITKDMLYD